MTSLIFLGVALWLLTAPFFAVKSYRWNRDTKDREQASALALSVLAGIFWPATMLFWDADSLRGDRTWRGDRYQPPIPMASPERCVGAVSTGGGGSGGSSGLA